MVEIYTDGSCRGNGKENSKGGFGVVAVVDGLVEFVYNEDAIDTTNNREELKAIISALELTQTDYKDVSMVVLAWDSEGYPIKMCEMWGYDSNYVKYIGLENIGPKKTSEYSYTFETADIAYMSVFLSYYEDFDGNEWENPIIEEVEENKGQKLDKTELYYFTFQ